LSDIKAFYSFCRASRRDKDKLSTKFRRWNLGDNSCYTAGMGLSSYIDAALASAHFKKLKDMTCFGEIPGFAGVWANEKTQMKCRAVLREVLEDWLVAKLRCADPLPSVHGKTLTVPELRVSRCSSR
jgi:hypothetical protein